MIGMIYYESIILVAKANILKEKEERISTCCARRLNIRFHVCNAHITLFCVKYVPRMYTISK